LGHSHHLVIDSSYDGFRIVAGLSLGGLMSVQRENGSAEVAVGTGSTTITVSVDGQQTVSDDLLDRILQFVMIELGIDTAWQAANPEPEVVPLSDPNPTPVV
jgi:hypothetical protein